jgi:DNA polymerase elongation subunit (family B)
MKGFLLDCYPARDNLGGMTFWIKSLNGDAVKLHDRSWRARIYAAGKAADDPGYVLSAVSKRSAGLVRSIKFSYKRPDITVEGVKRVLEIELEQAGRARQAAELLESIFQNPFTFQLFNVDVLPEQSYFYEKEIFPLALLEVETRGDEVSSWKLKDSVESTTYRIPDLKYLKLDVGISGLVPRLDSRLEAISLSSAFSGDVQSFTIEREDESDTIAEAVKEIRRFDPDILITENGDSFVLPFLASKAARYSLDLALNRDDAVANFSINSAMAKTYFSYGKILYRPSTQRLYGRVHLDRHNTFVYDQCQFAGLFEVSRLCRIPLHTSARASIGKCLSGLQFYYAAKKDILIPWKPVIAEDIKNGYELFVGDRGGLVLESEPGVHFGVGELDFASLYPSIIYRYNISAETVNCSCCNRESGHAVDRLDMHICRHQDGIVAKSLYLPLSKRFEYKKLRDSATDKELKAIYGERAASLKWILVCCLARESPVLVQQNGLIKYVKIGDLVDGTIGDKEGIIDCPAGISVAGVGHDLKSKFCKVQKLLKIPNRRKLLRITADDGRRIVATPDHPCYLWKNGVLEIRGASELEEGDFIPVAKEIPRSQNSDMPNSISSQTASQSGQLVLEMAASESTMFQGDLGFARIKKVEELDRIDDYVYCFQLADDELPGFFSGEGAVFTHNCFGYLSYRNAKFGKIDSHMAVCAYARKTLLDAMHVSESRGYEVIHGIVDSLWLSRKGATEADYAALCREIESVAHFRIVLEGIYKWIVFLPSKVNSSLQVANRYFGCFRKNNEIKVRGVELRRNDSPPFFKECQQEILTELAKRDTLDELNKCAWTDGVSIFNEYARRLERHDVSPLDLLIMRRLSKDLEDYASQRQLSVNAALKLEHEGLKLKAGQSVSYVITRYKTLGTSRALPEELASYAEYDSRRYVELLADCCATVLSPFSVTKQVLLSRSRPLG